MNTCICDFVAGNRRVGGRRPADDRQHRRRSGRTDRAGGSRSDGGVAHARRGGAPGHRARIPIWRSSVSIPKSKRRASARAAARSRRCSRRRSAARTTATPPANLLLGDRGVSVEATGFRRPASASACRGAPAPGAFPGTRRARPPTPDQQLRSERAVGISDRLLAAAVPRPRHRRRAPAVHRREAQSGELRAGFREALVRTVASVKLAYWTLKASIANVTVQQRSLELAEELARENRVRVEGRPAGRRSIVVQAEAEVAQRRESLIRARTGAEDAEDALRRLIIDPRDPSFWSVRLDPADDPSPVGPLPDVDRRGGDGAQRAIRPCPRATRISRTAGPPSSSLQKSAAARRAPRDVVRRRPASPARSSCAPADFPGVGDRHARHRLRQTRSARRSRTTTRRGASGSR